MQSQISPHLLIGLKEEEDIYKSPFTFNSWLDKQSAFYQI